MKFLFLIFAVIFGIGVFQSQNLWEAGKKNIESALSAKWSLQMPRLNAASPSDSARFARALYYYVSGPPSAGYPAGFNGPKRGIFGLLNDILGDVSVQQALTRKAVRNCDSLPTEGTLSVGGHSLGDLVFTFSPGSKKVPQHFLSSPGVRYIKRIDVDKNSLPLMAIEMLCSTASGIHTGYMSLEEDRKIEIYFQLDRKGQRRQVDVYMDFPESAGNTFNEKLVLRFESVNGEDFKMWAVRTTSGNSNEGSVAVAINGNVETRKAEISIVEDSDTTPDNSTTLGSGSKVCVDLATESTTTDCESVTDPEPGVKGDGFTIADTNEVPVTAIDYLRPDTFNLEFEPIAVDQVTHKNLQITNVSSEEVTAIEFQTVTEPFAFSGGSYPGAGGTCGSSLAAGASCLLAVDYAPKFGGPHNGQMDVNYVKGGKNYTTSILLTGSTLDGETLAHIEILGPQALNFGDVIVGNSSSDRLTIVNTGSAEATQFVESGLAAPFGFLGGSYPGTNGYCGAVLAPGASCDIQVAFTPQAVGSTSGMLILSYNDGLASRTVQRELIGHGLLLLQFYQ